MLLPAQFISCHPLPFSRTNAATGAIIGLARPRADVKPNRVAQVGKKFLRSDFSLAIICFSAYLHPQKRLTFLKIFQTIDLILILCYGCFIISENVPAAIAPTSPEKPRSKRKIKSNKEARRKPLKTAVRLPERKNQ